MGELFDLIMGGVLEETVQTEEVKVSVCPKGHIIPWLPELYAKDNSDNLRDADGRPMYENGLWCHGCDRAYGLSKLRDE